MEKSCLRDFDVLSKLGEGAFGQVFKVKRKADGKEYALKKVKIRTLKAKQRENALNQIRIMASYDGQFIIGYKQAFYDQASETLCIVMQFAAQGDLLKKVQTHIRHRTKFKQEQIWKALIHMTKGLKLLHEKKILHRDLKCANIFLTADGSYKLGDLNVSKVLKKQLAETQTGTPYYASPEVWKDKPYGPKSDMWSLGCVLYQMAALKPPFSGPAIVDLQGLYRKICIGIFQRIPLIYSNQLANVISLLLQVDPSKRPTAEQLLNHPIVLKKSYSQTITHQEQTNCDQLLKTIKYNPKDLRGLKNYLPKSNYENPALRIQEEKQQDDKQKVDEIKNISNADSVKTAKKQTQSNAIGDQKLKDYLEKRRALEQKEKEKQIKVLQEQRQELNKKRQRVLSACGVKTPFVYQSPKIQAHHKDQLIANKQPISQRNVAPPPRIPKPPPTNHSQHNSNAQQKINYRLPPRPLTRQDTKRINQSYEDNGNIQQKQKDKIYSERYKQNEIKIGEKNSSRHLPRSNSQQRIIYPSWWG